jgi:hypothetical protein
MDDFTNAKTVAGLSVKLWRGERMALIGMDVSLEVKKPDGSIGIVDFEFLAESAPEPFKSEWSGGKGVHEHHKFVVTDFNLLEGQLPHRTDRGPH